MCSDSSARSSAEWSPVSSGTSSSVADAATARSASTTATPTPTATAVTRSTATVTTNVSASTAASLRVDRARASSDALSIICTAVAKSTPASAASGIRLTSGPAVKTITARTPACTTAESFDVAPARTFTAVRAMAPVAGTPPNTGAARFARPCPNSSRSGSVVWLTLMPSATVADSRLSSAASAAIASADGSIALNVAGSRKPKDGAGRPARDVPEQVGADREDLRDDGRQADGQERERDARPDARPDEHDRRDAERDRDRAGGRIADEGRDGVERHAPHVLVARGAHAERHGHLLERDDDRDPRGEPLDDGHRQVAHEPPEPGDREDDEDQAGHRADHQDALGAEARDHRQQDDGHRPGRSGDLEVRPAEDRGDGARDDRGGQPGLRAETRGDAEGERERQRDDRDGDAGDEVAAGRAARVRPVRAARQQRRDPRPQARRRHQARSAARSSLRSSSRSVSSSVRIRRAAVMTSDTSDVASV